MKTLTLKLCWVVAVLACLLAAGQVAATEVVPRFAGNQYVNLGTPSALQIAGNQAFTVEGWVKLETLTETVMLYSKNNGRTSPYSYLLGLTGTGTRMSAYTGAGGTPANIWVDARLPATLSVGRWYHLAYSFNGTYLAFYLDGVLLDVRPFGFGNTTTHTAKIGGHANLMDPQGNISDIRVWNHARTGDQIAAYRFRRLNGSEPGILGYWPLNEGSGTVVVDSTPSGSNGTLIGGVTWATATDFALTPSGSGYGIAMPFTLADLVTGSTRFTNSNQVDVASLPIPDGCDYYQITLAGNTADINPDGWLFTNIPPARQTFDAPVAEMNFQAYAWFTNSTVAAKVQRAEGSIYHTAVVPVPSVRAALTRLRLPGRDARVWGADLDAGSTGGQANGLTLAINRAEAICVNPGDNATPGESFITLTADGVYPLLLRLRNEAGNSITATATCLVTVALSSVDTNLWTGGGGDDRWLNSANWSAGLPQAGQNVAILAGSGTRLTNATVALNSFYLGAGRTLTVEGWESALQATNLTIAGTVTHLAQGVISPDATFCEWTPKHRIFLKGSNLTVAAGGVLNADYMGYQHGAGPGRPAGVKYSGGGYGGTGGDAFGGGGHGPANGVPDDPWQPGSGGGINLSVDGVAGGAIRIELSGRATIDGTLSACGANGGTTHASAGSGGGIALYCKTFQGAASGLIRADGGRGNYYGGNGGGGRIALHYDPASQSSLGIPRPPVRLSTHAWKLDSRNTYRFTTLAEMGTLFLPDLTLLTGAPTSAAVLDGHRFWYTRLCFGTPLASWSPASLAISNCVVAFPEGMDLHVGNDLVLAGTVPVLRGDDAIRGGLRLYAVATDGLYGARLTVGRDFLIGAAAWLYPNAHGFSSAVLGVRVARNLTVAATGGIDADETGYRAQIGNLNGPGAGKGTSAGGAYGGYGGHLTESRDVYGSAELPLDPGSPGGWYTWTGDFTQCGYGGGAIHLLAGGDMTINGLLTAVGGRGWYYRSAGGSGGSIFLAAMRIAGSGTLRASGGDGEYDKVRAGGGGRIAIWHHMPLDGVEARIAARDTSGLASSASYSSFTGELNVDKGRVAEVGNATAGTKGFYTIAGTLVILR